MIAAAPGTQNAPSARAPSTFHKLPLGGTFFNKREFASIAEKHESNGEKRLILTTLALGDDDNIADFVIKSAQNWLYHLHNVGRAHNAIIIGVDARTCDILIANQVPCFIDHMTTAWLRDPSIGYMPGGRQGVIKWYFTEVLLDLGYDVLYMDTDTVALHDPFYHWDEKAKYEYDFQALSDYAGITHNRPWDKLKRDCQLYNVGGPDPSDMPVLLCASTGLFYLRATNAGKVFAKAMVETITAEPQTWEAKHAQKVALSFTFGEASSDILMVRLLDVAKFSNLGIYEERARKKMGTNQLIALHCGLMVTSYKSMKLASLGKWNPMGWNYEVLENFSVEGGYLVNPDSAKIAQVVPVK